MGGGMVHQHFKLVECFTVLDNIILGVEPTKFGFLQKKEARQQALALSERYGSARLTSPGREGGGYRQVGMRATPLKSSMRSAAKQRKS
ncbi:MAG: hypothetical protein ACLTXW_15175 [Christensenellales bacterium]